MSVLPSKALYLLLFMIPATVSSLTVTWWARDVVGRCFMAGAAGLANLFLVACVLFAPRSVRPPESRKHVAVIESGILLGIVVAACFMCLMHIRSVDELLSKLATIRRGDPVSYAERILEKHIIARRPDGLYCRANPEWSKKHIGVIDAIVESDSDGLVSYITVFHPDD